MIPADRRNGTEAQGLYDGWSITMLSGLAIIFATIGYNTYKFGGNWDEYLVLSRVFLYVDGELSGNFRAFLVHGFSWLQWVNGLSLDRIEAARVAMWILSIGTLVSLFWVGRHYLSQRASIFALLSYTTFSYVFEHLASFRADPVITFFLVSGAALILASNTTSAIFAGIAIAIATTVSIKSALYFPAIGALFIYQIYRGYLAGCARAMIRNAAITLISSAVAMAVLFLLHGFLLKGGDTLGGDVRWLSGNVDQLIWSAGFFPRLDYAANVAQISYMVILIWIAGVFITVRGIIHSQGATRARLISLLFLASPVISLLFYRNAYSYFYVFMLPLPALLCGVTFDAVWWNKDIGRATRNMILAVIVMGVGHGAWYTIWKNQSRSQDTQRALLSGIEEIFPESVSYIDRCSMVADYPKAGFFMETRQMEDYHANGEPIMREVIIEKQPKFILANHYALLLHLSQPESTYTLMPEDVQSLRANYVPHWELVFIAGKSLTIAGSGDHEFEILIPGEYTVETADTVEIDGAEYESGDIIDLVFGRHRIRGRYANQEVVLRCGDSLPVPEESMPAGPLFDGLM